MPKNFKAVTRICIALVLIVANVGCDQITKNIARESLSPGSRIEVIQNHFTLLKVENTGAALSIGQHLPPVIKTVVLQVLPGLVLLLLLIYVMVRRQLSKTLVIAFSFIIGGGIGNIYDRVLYSSVTDFMHLKAGVLQTGIFNMADVSVMFGTFLLLVHHLQQRRAPKAPTPAL